MDEFWLCDVDLSTKRLDWKLSWGLGFEEER